MPNVPTTHDFGTGLSSSTEVNAYIRDPLLFWMNRPHARLRQAVAQSIPSSTFTAITFDTEEVDTDWTGTGGHSTSVNPSRYTANYAGWYRCSGGIGFVASATGRRISAWYVNGTAINASQTANPATAALDCQIVARTEEVFLNVGDYVELVAYQESGGALLTIVTAGTQSSMNVRFEGVA